MEIKGTNEHTHLILKYNHKNNIWEDRTAKIIYLNQNYNGSFYVIFINNSKRSPYDISQRDLKISTTPKKIYFDRNKVFVNNKKTSELLQILYFPNLGYKLFFADNKNIFTKELNLRNNEIHLIDIPKHKNISSNNIFNYYYDLAHYAASLQSNELSVEKLLALLYSQSKEIEDNSALDGYTKQDIHKVNDKNIRYICPFKTNASQLYALINTFENNLFVISGPPGTGKTQVILNIISTAILNNKKIAIISNNNTALKNIYDKMAEMNLSFLLAELGNQEIVEKFFNNQKDFTLELNNLKKLRTNLYVNTNSLLKKSIDLFNFQNEIIKLKQKLFNMEIEFNHYKQFHDYTDMSFCFSKQDKDYKQYLKLKNYLSAKKKFNFLVKLKLKLVYKLNKFDENKLYEIINYITYQYYNLKIKSITANIKEEQKLLDENNLEKISNALQEASLNLLINYLTNKFREQEPFRYNKDNYKEYFHGFMCRYPVILSTTYSLLRNIQKNFKFDLIIMDEASQSDIMSSFLTMGITNQYTVMGDEKQLQQIDNQEIYEASEFLFKRYNIEPLYRYKENSILTSFLSIPNMPHTILKEHYRCDSRIIQFCNKKFYENELIIATKTDMTSDPLYVIHTIAGNHARKNPNGTGQYNDRESQEILKIILSLKKRDIGVITPFRCQADYIRNLLQQNGLNYVEVDTIHSYQGRQKNVVILSTVVNNITDEDDDFISNFVTNGKLLNVAISRAIKQLYLVVSDKVYNSEKNNISQFIGYIKYYCNSESIQQGRVVSIFDCLYSDEYKIAKKYNKFNFDSTAEEIVYNKLSSILKTVQNYNFHMHVRLSDLVSNLENFTKEEKIFIRRPHTHCDFVIYDTVTYKPIFAIEVDGTRYHDYNKKQIYHDNVKTLVLKQNDIPLIRLKTNESNEINKIKEALRRYL